MTQFFKWLCQFFAFPRRKINYGLIVSDIKYNDNNNPYIDIVYSTNICFDKHISSALKNGVYVPLDLILADDFRKELQMVLNREVVKILEVYKGD